MNLESCGMKGDHNMAVKSAKWIWYPGDLETYHGMRQNFQREERGYGWPAYWKMDDWHKNVKFTKEYELEAAEEFSVRGIGQGYVEVNGKKHAFEEMIYCDPGHTEITVCIGNMTGLPCIYAAGNVIRSDESWTADDFETGRPAGASKLYQEKEQDPNRVYFEEQEVYPVSKKEVNGGVLFDFARMVNGTVKVKQTKPVVTICFGESDREALDTQWCYYKQENVTPDSTIRKRAFRYLYIPDCRIEEIDCYAVHEHFPIEVKAEFSSDDELLDQIWDVAKKTYQLCSVLFFIDGIKRDRWIWSGDAYQSYFVNPYLFFDEDINKRTILALRGNREIRQHINTIVDYSLLWVISIADHYRMTGDTEFLNMVFDKMQALMDLCEAQTDENGFLYGREQDWIFIDWCDMDKTGVIAAEQMLLLKCYETMAESMDLLGMPGNYYVEKAAALKKNIIKFFWDEEKGAFIDSFESGKRNVTRHANIFAVLFDIADEKQTEAIVKNVLFNEKVTAISTPYFKFYEMDVLAKLGYLGEVLKRVKEYWGGMLSKGAVTFWEEFDPKQSEAEQYGMYGDPFGKSLCHAWGASPIYLLGKYYLGVYPTKPGYEAFEVSPRLGFFKELDCTVPVKDGKVDISYKEGILNVTADRDGGILKINGKEWRLTAGVCIQVEYFL